MTEKTFTVELTESELARLIDAAYYAANTYKGEKEAETCAAAMKLIMAHVNQLKQN